MNCDDIPSCPYLARNLSVFLRVLIGIVLDRMIQGVKLKHHEQ